MGLRIHRGWMKQKLGNLPLRTMPLKSRLYFITHNDNSFDHNLRSQARLKSHHMQIIILGHLIWRRHSKMCIIYFGTLDDTFCF